MASRNPTTGLECFLLNDCEFKNVNAIEKLSILHFSPESFEKCHKALHVRNVLRIKYQNVNLSSAHVDVYGYHSICYKNVTALSKKQIEKSETVEPYPAQTERSRSNFPIAVKDENEAGTGKSIASAINRMTDCSAEIQKDVNAELPKEPTAQTSVNPIKVERNDEALRELKNNVLDGNGGQVVKNNCVFCGKFRKKMRGKELKISISKQPKFKKITKENASKRQDKIMADYLNTLSDDDPVYYHHLCQTRYYKAHTLASPKAEHGEWHISREIHNRVFAEIFSMVSETVIKNRKFLLLQDLLNRAREMLEQEYKDAFGSFDTIFTAHKLLCKLVAQFPSEIKIFKSVKEKKKVVASADWPELLNDDLVFSKI